MRGINEVHKLDSLLNARSDETFPPGDLPATFFCSLTRLELFRVAT